MKVFFLSLFLSFGLFAQEARFSKPDLQQSEQQGIHSVRWHQDDRVYSFGNVTVNPNTQSRPSMMVFNIKAETWDELETGERFPQHYVNGVTWSDKSSLYLFGGHHPQTMECSSELWEYSFETKRWSQTEAERTLPPKRHSAMTWQTPTALWMFGGRYMDSDGQSAFRNDLWAWDSEGKYWKQLEYSKETPVPTPRCGSVGWHDDKNKLYYLHGGLGREGALDDMWVCDTESGTWKMINEGNHGSGIPLTRFNQESREDEREQALNPGYRMYALSWIFKDDLYLFGGYKDGVGADLLIWKYSLATGLWNHIFARNYPDPYHFSSIVTTAEGKFILLGRTQNMECRECAIPHLTLELK